MLAGAAVIVAAGLWFGGIVPPGGSGEHLSAVTAPASTAAASRQQAQPSFLSDASPRVREAYAFAAGHGDDLIYIPCYCGCGEHSGHRNVRDCFIKQQTAAGITYDDHGSGCDICVSIVLDVKAKQAEGQTLAATRKFIDARYSKIGPGTNTPLPPGMEE